MIDPISFPDPCSVEMKVNITAGKVNELIEHLNDTTTVATVEKQIYSTFSSPGVCIHKNHRQTKIGTWFCKDCHKFIKAPA